MFPSGMSLKLVDGLEALTLIYFTYFTYYIVTLQYILVCAYQHVDDHHFLNSYDKTIFFRPFPKAYDIGYLLQ